MLCMCPESPTIPGLDFETTPQFSLEIEVTDGTNVATNTITIDLNDINEAPVIANASFSIEENSPQGTIGGTLSVSDPESDALIGVIEASDPNDLDLTISIDSGNEAGQFRLDPMTYTLISGNDNNTFGLNETNGEVVVTNSEAIDFDAQSDYLLTVDISDGVLTTQVDLNIIM